MALARILATEEVRAPESFDRATSEGCVRLSWSGPAHGTCVAAGLIGLLFGAGLLAAALKSPRLAPGLGTTSALFAAASTYLLLGGLLNRTVLLLGDSHLSIHQRPLPCPWPSRCQGDGLRKLLATEVYRLWVEEEPAGAPRESREPTYCLLVMTIGTGREELLVGLGRQEAGYLAQEIRACVGIVD